MNKKIIFIVLVSFLSILCFAQTNITPKKTLINTDNNISSIYDKNFIQTIENIIFKYIDKKNNITATKVINLLKKYKTKKTDRKSIIIDILIEDIRKKYLINKKSWEIYPHNSKLTEIATNLNLNKPLYLKSVIDHIFNVKITNIASMDWFQQSNKVLKPVRENHILPPYPKNQAWSHNDRYIRINNTLLDWKTYQIIKNIWWSIFERKWSYTEDNIIYGIMYEYNNSWNKINHTFVKQNVDNLKITKLHKFSTKDFDEVLLWPWEWNISFDDKLVVFSAKKDNDLIAIVYNIKTDTIISQKTLKNYWDKLDWISISPLGNYILLNWESEDKNGDFVNSIYKYDTHLNFLSIVSKQWQHWDMGINENWEEIYVQFEFGEKRKGIRLYNLKTKKSIKLLPSKYNGWHVSCRNYNYPGWCYISTHQKGFREIFALKLDNSQTVKRFWQTHQSDNGSSYGSPNPNGTKVLFKSYWWDKIENSFISEPYIGE